MSDELQGRLNNLEETFAHHEALVHDLSDELAKQWQVIEKMTRHIQILEEKIETMRVAEEAPSGSEPPPHY